MHRRRKFPIYKQDIVFFVLAVAYKAILDAIYYSLIAKKYAYAGFSSSPTLLTQLFSWALFVMFTLLANKSFANKKQKLSDEILFLLYLLSLIPFLTMLGMGALTGQFAVACIVFWLLIFLFERFIHFSFEEKEFKLFARGLIDDKRIKIIAAVFFLIVLYVAGRYSHFRFTLSLSEVYDFRAEAKAYNMPTLLVYLTSWTRNVNAIILAYFIRKKNWTWAAVCVLIQILNFSIDGSKSTLFLAVVAIVVNLLPHINTSSLNKVVLGGLVAMFGIAYIVYLRTGQFAILSLFVRRVCYVPVQLETFYFDFFTNNQPDFFRQSFLRLFGFQSPYSQIPTMIGRVYLNTTTNANNGLISDAITNLGYIGVVVFPLLYSLLFKLLDKSTKGVDPRIYITVAFFISTSLINTFLTTAMLTHGILVAMLLLVFIKRDTLLPKKDGIE